MVKIPSLHRKLLRDIKAARVQFGAVSLVILLGISVYVGTYAAYLNLDISYNTAFHNLKMADYWITVDHISQDAQKDMDDITGVTAQGRIVGDISVETETDTGETISGRVISLPVDHRPAVNDVQVIEGSYLTALSGREMLVEKHFADYHGLHPGDWLTLKLGDSRAKFEIVGVVVSPEYLWVAKSAQEPFTTPRTFGIFFLPQRTVEDLFSMSGKYNELTFIVDPAVSSDKVINGVQDVLRKYQIKRLVSKDEPLAIRTRKIDIIEGARTAYMIQRKDQISNRLLKQDLDGFQEMAFLFPLLFLTMASLAIYVLLSRLIESQRVQIGLLSAIGYGKHTILFHYLGYALVVGITGSLLGIGLGSAIAGALTAEYVAQLGIPIAVVHTHSGVLGIGLLVGIAVPVMSSLLPAWLATRVRPAEAMHAAPQMKAHRSLPEIVFPFLSRLPYLLKLPMRNVFRNFRRTLFMAMGVASAVILILVSMSFVDAMQNLIDVQFREVQLYDAALIFRGREAAAVTSFIQNLNGVQRAEPVLEVPYRLRNGDYVSDSSIMGLPVNSRLYGLVDHQGRELYPTADSILMPLALKDKLQVEVGDTISLEPLVGTVGETEKRIAGFVDSPVGTRSFMPLPELQHLLRAPGTISGVLLKFTAQPQQRLLKRLYDIRNTSSLEFSSDTRKFIDDFMGFFWVFVGVLLIMGASLGAAIIFNAVTVNVLERRREIAIMRAIGMENSKLSLMLTLENIAVACLGIIIGITAGYFIAVYFMSTFDTDILSMSVIILPRSYIIACVSAFVILLVSQFPALRQISHISLPTVTKDWAE
jgi:putative ABC transport system permease protein